MEKSPPDQNYLKLLRGQDWPDLIKRLHAHSAIFYGELSPETREEYCQAAIAKVCLGEQAWNPESRPSLLEHLKWVLRSVVSNETRKHQVSKKAADVLNDEGTLVNPVDIVQDETESILEVLIKRELVEQMRNILSNDDEALLVFMAIEDGATKPSEIERETEYAIEKIRVIMKRIRRHVGTLLE